MADAFGASARTCEPFKEPDVERRKCHGVVTKRLQDGRLSEEHPAAALLLIVPSPCFYPDDYFERSQPA